MNAQEMHIEIDLELQKINSQSTKNLLPQEKDWFLNKEVIKYLQAKLDPTSNIKQLGFEDTAKRVEDIKDLVRVSSEPIRVNNRGKSYITLPSDYFAYIRFDGFSLKKCPNVKGTSTQRTTYKSVFKIEMPTVALTAYKIEVVTSGGTTEVFNITNLPSNYLSSTEFNKQEFLLVKALKIQLLDKLKEVLSPNTYLYWEIEGYNYNSRSFTVVSDTEFISINITTNALPVVVNTVTSVVDTVYTLDDTLLKGKIRIIDDEFYTDVENSHLSNSRAYSPIGNVRESVLELSDVPSAIFTNVNIVYVCKPNIIDLLLNSNLNVSEKVAKKIVSNTVQTLKGIIGTRDLQNYTQQNILTE